MTGINESYNLCVLCGLRFCIGDELIYELLLDLEIYLSYLLL